MHPRLQTAFDVMYAKAEQFIPASLRPMLTQYIKDGDFAFAASTVAERLLTTAPVPSNAQAYRTTVAAFAEFWRVFTELAYGTAAAAQICAICGQKKGAH